jgi:hypothetical protein
MDLGKGEIRPYILDFKAVWADDLGNYVEHASMCRRDEFWTHDDDLVQIEKTFKKKTKKNVSHLLQHLFYYFHRFENHRDQYIDFPFAAGTTSNKVRAN